MRKWIMITAILIVLGIVLGPWALEIGAWVFDALAWLVKATAWLLRTIAKVIGFWRPKGSGIASSMLLAFC